MVISNIKNFSMLSSSHFLSKKQNTMPKRDHEWRTREGGGKIKASKLDIKNLSPKQSPSLDLDASHITGDQGLVRNSFFTSAEISARDKVENPTATSQEWRRDDNPFSCTVKSVREINQCSSMVKPVRGIQNLLTRMKLDYQNLEVSDDPYVAIHLGQKYNENLIPYRNNNFDALNTLVLNHAEVDLESAPRDSECFHDWLALHSLDEIYLAAWQSN